jgi:putative inorganic carbon (hco3(-)) transporter
VKLRGRPALVLAAAALAVAASAYVSVRHGHAQRPAFENVLIGVGAAVGALISLTVRPAWPLSLGLALAAFSSHWHTMGIPLPLDRLLLASAVVSTLARERVREPGALVTRPIDWLLIVTGLYAIGSALWVGTLSDHIARFALTDRFSLVGFVLFFIARRAYRDPRDRRILLGTLVALGAYLGITAVLETTGPSALIFPHYITDPSVGIHFGRARGPFAEADADGLALYMCTVASVIAALTWRDPRARRLAWVVGGLSLFGVLLSLTRAPWVAAIAGSVIALLVPRQTRRLVIPSAALVAVGIVVAFAAVPHLQARATGRANDQQPIWDRKNSDAAALRMIAARPVLGFGWGRFAYDSIDYYRESQDYPLTLVPEVHNVYLDNAVSLGLVGAGLWLAACGIVLLGGVWRRGPPVLRPWKIGLLAVGISYGVNAMLTPLGFALPTLLLWVWAGIAWGPDSAEPATARAGVAPAPAPAM